MSEEKCCRLQLDEEGKDLVEKRDCEAVCELQGQYKDTMF